MGSLYDAGTLIESVRIAASKYGRSVEWTTSPCPEGIKLSVSMPKDDHVFEDSLEPYLSVRSVNRALYSTKRLLEGHKAALEECLTDDYGILWFESFWQRLRFACLNVSATALRLQDPAAFSVHQHVIDHRHSFSPTGMPIKTLKLSTIFRILYPTFMKDWPHVTRANRFLLAHKFGALDMDLLAGIFCGAHFVVYHKQNQTPQSERTVIERGQIVQRFWLTVTKLGLSLQPNFGPKLFSAYPRSPQATINRIKDKSERLKARTEAITGKDVNAIIFLGRIGYAKKEPIRSRSIRKSLKELCSSQDINA